MIKKFLSREQIENIIDRANALRGRILARFPEKTPEEINVRIARFVMTEAHKGVPQEKIDAPFYHHPLFVGNRQRPEPVGMQMGYLHDTKEDCGIKIEDFHAMGFSPDVIRGVMALSKIPWTLYFDYMAGLSLCPDDRVLRVKLDDSRHNIDATRINHKEEIYMINIAYLESVLAGTTKRGTTIATFIESQGFRSSVPPEEMQGIRELVRKNSSATAVAEPATPAP